MKRFWEHVKKTKSCWIWVGAKKGRYGFFNLENRPVRVHRFAYELMVGKIPRGLFVCHKCDNPPCVHPDHLYLATARQNMEAMDQRGRRVTLKGTELPYSKLTEIDVVEIRQLHDDGVSVTEIAELYPVCGRTIWRVVTGRAWKHVKVI